MKKRERILAVGLALLLLCACRATGENSPAPGEDGQKPATDTTEPGTPQTPEDPVEALLARMTLREKVGQLFMIRPDALEPSLTGEEIAQAKGNGVTALSAAMQETLSEYPCGGIAIFGKNIESPKQLTAFLAALQSGSKIGLLMGVDEEGGAVSRLANHPGFELPRYESMAAIGATGEAENARRVGLTIGGYLRGYGFNLDFAPVADVNTNPDNPVIGTRAFGSDPAQVSRMVEAEIAGLHEAGIMSCIKHFPGHGDTKEDTHLGFAATAKSWEEMLSCELVPFRAGIAAGTDLVMAAHITAENVTADELPASLSPVLLTEKLRGELGYEGVIITDALAMGAITESNTSAEAAKAAFTAGADLLLMPWDYREAFEGILQAVEEGTISEARLDESVRRILCLKLEYGLIG